MINPSNSFSGLDSLGYNQYNCQPLRSHWICRVGFFVWIIPLFIKQWLYLLNFFSSLYLLSNNRIFQSRLTMSLTVFQSKNLKMANTKIVRSSCTSSDENVIGRVTVAIETHDSPGVGLCARFGKGCDCSRLWLWLVLQCKPKFKSVKPKIILPGLLVSWKTAVCIQNISPHR